MKIETARTILGYVKQYEDLSDAKLKASHFDWKYQTNEKRIIFAVEYTDKQKKFDKWVIEYLKETYDANIKYEHMEIFKLLHEVGHHVNGSICTQGEYYYLTLQAKDNYEYRSIPDEKEADLFAINFMKEHLENLLDLIKGA
jgi:Zn-dependent peptidase ImmA (M78 family)